MAIGRTEGKDNHYRFIGVKLVCLI